MKATKAGDYFEVTVQTEDLQSFASAWPAHGIDLDSDPEFRFQFHNETGDLVDITMIVDGKEVDEDIDGHVLLALSDDACRYGASELALNEVIEIRFPDQQPRL